MNQPACPFCNLPQERIFLETGTTLVFLDAYPVTEEHTLVIPKRHVASIFELPREELAALWAQVATVRALLADIGINDGESAGQAVPHAHVHVIPRRKGDCLDPRGGIRWILPGKAKYW